MQWRELAFASPAQSLAWEEALLEFLDEDEVVRPGLLAVYEPTVPYVVIGYGNDAAREVDLEFCQKNKIPVLRRCSGGGAVLQAPGCVDYALFLPIDAAPELHSIGGTNRWVMERQRAAIASALQEPVEIHGDTDLAWRGQKFSGNAQRRKKRWLLFHGTFLRDFDLGFIESCLRAPSREPAYRAGRAHRDFLVRLPLDKKTLYAALRAEWRADVISSLDAPADQVERLRHEKYDRPAWNLRHVSAPRDDAPSG